MINYVPFCQNNVDSKDLKILPESSIFSRAFENTVSTDHDCVYIHKIIRTRIAGEVNNWE